MTSSPTTSVVVPVRHGARTLAACLESLLRLDPAADEIIVVDNGSTDGTLAILDRYRDVLCVVREARVGSAAARNAGVRQARGQIIAFTDADCMVAPDWLGAIRAPLSDDRIGVVGGRNLSPPGANRISRYGEHVFDQAFAIHTSQPPFVISMNWASRRDLLVACGLFDPTLPRAHDVEFAYRIWRAGYTLHYAPEAIVYHHNPDSWRRLVRQGFLHGYHVLAVYSKHEDSLRRVVRRPRLHLTAQVRHLRGHTLRPSSRPRREPFELLCHGVFTASRLAGKVAGMVRFRTFDL